MPAGRRYPTGNAKQNPSRRIERRETSVEDSSLDTRTSHSAAQVRVYYDEIAQRKIIVLRSIRTVYARIQLGAALIAILTLAVILPVVLYEINVTAANSEEQALEGHYRTLVNQIGAEVRRAETAAVLLAQMPELQQAFADGQRERLIELLKGAFAELKKNHAITVMQFNLPPASVFLRVHNPEKFGDDVSATRPMLVKANTERVQVGGIEAGTSGLSIRGLMPVFHQGRHIGAVEVGTSFGQEFFERFKQDYGIDVAFHVKQADGGFKTYASTIGESAELLDGASLQKALAGEVQLAHGELNGKPVSIYAKEIYDYAGKAIGVVELAVDRSQIQASMAYVRNITLAIGAAMLVVGFLLSRWLARTIVRPLGGEPDAAIAAFQKIAAGDLTAEVPVQPGDTASLMAAAQRMRDELRRMMADLLESAKAIESAANAMAAAGNRVAEGSSSQSEASSAVAAAVEEMSASISETASNAKSADELAVRAQTGIEQTLQAMRDTVANVEGLVGMIHEASRNIAQLDESSKKIGGIVQVIKEIADQTNLLALNAAIEAARAGEQGRGFAVVADEVRKLAENTTKATNEIAGLIGGIQTQIDTAVALMQDANTRATQGRERVAASESALNAAGADTRHATESVRSIAEAVRAQDAAMQEVAQRVEQIAQMAEENSRAAQDAANTGRQLNTLANRLRSAVAKFRV